MKKALSLGVIVVYACISTVFADYTLTTADTAAVQEVIKKVKAKPFRTQEVVVYALKNAQNKKNYSPQKKAIFAAVESGLRQKTPSGDMMATSFERKEIVDSLLTSSDDTETISATIEVAGELSSSEEGEFAINGTLITDVDARDTHNPKVRLQLDIAASDDEESVDAAGELRVLDSVGYFLVKKFSLTPDEDQMVDTLAPFMNVWWKVPLDPSAMQEIEMSSVESTQDIESMRSALFKKNVIPKLFYKGQNQGSSVYTGTVDSVALVDMLSEIAALQGEDFDIMEMRESLKDITLQTYFSLDAQKSLSALSVTASINKKIETDTIRGTITFSIDISDTSGPIVAPDNARDMTEVFLSTEPTL